MVESVFSLPLSFFLERVLFPWEECVFSYLLSRKCFHILRPLKELFRSFNVLNEGNPCIARYSNSKSRWGSKNYGCIGTSRWQVWRSKFSNWRYFRPQHAPVHIPCSCARMSPIIESPSCGFSMLPGLLLWCINSVTETSTPRFDAPTDAYYSIG